MPYNTSSQTPDSSDLHERLYHHLAATLPCSRESHPKASDDENDKDEDEDEDKGYDASVSDNSSDTASADGVSEQQHDDMEEVANSTILGLANHEHHLSKSALKRDADSLAAMMEEDGWKYGDASMSDLEARIQAFGEDVERLHERVYGMKSRLEEEIEKSRERNREMDLWYERNVGAVEMEDGCLDWDVDGMDDKGESEDEETSAS